MVKNGMKVWSLDNMPVSTGIGMVVKIVNRTYRINTEEITLRYMLCKAWILTTKQTFA
ncbi:hypothetical protein BUAKA3JSW_01305 [Bacteroides uniformis]|jgi:hypothetical protein|nr:hypothetical protein BUAKA3JSW_01305 [Bacteroides uniformis]